MRPPRSLLGEPVCPTCEDLELQVKLAMESADFLSNALATSREQTAAVERERDELQRRYNDACNASQKNAQERNAAEREVSKLREALRPEVAAFARLMEQKLRENDHKGGWDQESKHWLLGRLKEETSELDNAICDWACTKIGSQGEREATVVVGREAADVANFAMMIADRCGSLRAAVSPAATTGEACFERCVTPDCDNLPRFCSLACATETEAAPTEAPGECTGPDCIKAHIHDHWPIEAPGKEGEK
jgi:hypothetical protein